MRVWRELMKGWFPISCPLRCNVQRSHFVTSFRICRQSPLQDPERLEDMQCTLADFYLLETRALRRVRPSKSVTTWELVYDIVVGCCRGGRLWLWMSMSVTQKFWGGTHRHCWCGFFWQGLAAASQHSLGTPFQIAVSGLCIEDATATTRTYNVLHKSSTKYTCIS